MSEVAIALAVGAVFIGSAITLPIEKRLWRAGRISDGTAALLVVVRAPAMTFLLGLIPGGFDLANLVFIAIALGVARLFYRIALTFMRDDPSRKVSPNLSSTTDQEHNVPV